MEKELEKELYKYSKEAIINAVIKNGTLISDRYFIKYVISEEIEILINKQTKIRSRRKSLSESNSYEENVKIIEENKRIDKQHDALSRKIDKLMKLK